MIFQRLSVATLASLLAAGTSLPAYADEQVRTFSQTSDFMGKMTAYVGNTGVRLESKRMFMVIVTQAPTWTVTSYRTTDKKYFQAPLPEWKKRFSFSPGQQKRDKKYTTRKGRTAQIAGLKATEYVLVTEHELKKRPKKPERFTEMWVASEIHPPKQAVEILSNAAGLPSDIGLPLRIVRHSHGKTTTTLDTVGSSTAKLTTAMLTLPKGYTKVKDEMTFFMGDDSEGLGGLVDSLK